ncbi:MAG: CHAT domain-containing protein, partial [Myxococcales bacterium]|nr:CHAT domain-containing protein [Myxococcales bacterium]
QPDGPDPRPLMRDLVQHIRDHELERRDPSLLFDAELNLAIAELEGGRSEAAAEHLAKALVLVKEKDLSWLDLVYVELIRAARESSIEAANDHFKLALEHARATRDDSQVQWVLLSRARFEVAGERYRAALVTHSEIEAVMASRTPGRDLAKRGFWWTRHVYERAEHIAVALRLDEREHAACVALGTRAGHIPFVHPAEDSKRRFALRKRYLELFRDANALYLEGAHMSKSELKQCRDALQRRRDEFNEEAQALILSELVGREPPRCAPPPAAGVARLLLHPRDLAGGWWLIIQHSEGSRFIELDSELELGRAVEDQLRGLDGEFDGIHTLELAPVTAANALPLHMWFDRFPNVHSIHYVLGGEAGSADVASSSGARRAVVMLGKADNLKGARAEVEWIGTQLDRDSWMVETDWSAGQLDPPALLHFAGHGEHHDTWAGVDALPLPGELDILVTDLVALRGVPRVVVIGACEAAALDPRTSDGGPSMAQGFLLAGSTLVIAPDVNVDDELARRFAEALYAVPPRPQYLEEDLERALVRIQRQNPEFGPWRAIRRTPVEVL